MVCLVLYSSYQAGSSQPHEVRPSMMHEVSETVRSPISMALTMHGMLR